MQIQNKKFLIVGSGITAATLATLLSEHEAKEVKVIEKNNHLGGNVFDYQDANGFFIHKYGPHIFHTNYDEVINFVKKYSEFDLFTHQVLVKYQDQEIIFPINFDSIYQITKSQSIIEKLKKHFQKEEQVSIRQLMNVNDEEIKALADLIYKNIYENYTMKMWEISADKIDLNVLNRVKINLNHEWNYFPNDKFVGMPKKGWTNMIENMLNHKNIKVFLNYDYKETYNLTTFKMLLDYHVYDAIFYTGMIDELFNYEHEALPYRSLEFTFEYLKDTDSFQNASVVNYPADLHFTRITEYKKLTQQNNLKGTVIGKEYPGQYDSTSPRFFNPCYPISNIETTNTYNKYLQELKKVKNLYCLGRLGQYKYYDTDDAIYSVLNFFKELINND